MQVVLFREQAKAFNSQSASMEEIFCNLGAEILVNLYTMGNLKNFFTLQKILRKGGIQYVTYKTTHFTTNSFIVSMFLSDSAISEYFPVLPDPRNCNNRFINDFRVTIVTGNNERLYSHEQY